MSTTSDSVKLQTPRATPAPQSVARAAVSQAGLVKKESFLFWLCGALPTMLVLLALVGIAVLGHQTGWNNPKFAELLGKGTKAPDDWCAEHGLPESICVECNESLMPKIKDHGFCKVHFVHNCPFENPDVIQMDPPYQVSKEDLDRFKRAWAIKERPKNNSRWTRYHRRIQLASQQAFEQMKIKAEEVELRRMTESIRVSGEITYEQPKVVPQNVPVSGRVLLVTAKGQLGTVVNEKDLLALVESPEVGKVKTEFAQAVVQLDQRTKYLEDIKPLIGSAIPANRVREAETAVRESQIQLAAAQQTLLTFGIPVQAEQFKGLLPDEIGKRLQFLGLSAEELKELNLRTLSRNLLPVRASSAGIVTDAKATPGKGIDPSTPLFVIADNRKMWLLLNVRVDDEKYVRIKKNDRAKDDVIFRPDGRDEEVSGRLVWKGSAVDKLTRTVQFRAVLDNSDGRLLADTFGSGDIIIRDEEQAMAVPNSAVHWDGEAHFVFVMDKNFSKEGAPKVFHVRSVVPGVRDASYTEILAGLVPGEWVATQNSALLRGELLKADLGDG